MCEPIPAARIGLMGNTLVTVLSPYALYGPAELAKPVFNPENPSLPWTLSGFANTTLWLIFSAFVIAFGYEKTGLGKRIGIGATNPAAGLVAGVQLGGPLVLGGGTSRWFSSRQRGPSPSRTPGMPPFTITWLSKRQTGSRAV
jgi:di/tricarboxylate transporter